LVTRLYGISQIRRVRASLLASVPFLQYPVAVLKSEKHT